MLKRTTDGHCAAEPQPSSAELDERVASRFRIGTVSQICNLRTFGKYQAAAHFEQDDESLRNPLLWPCSAAFIYAPSS